VPTGTALPAELKGTTVIINDEHCHFFSEGFFSALANERFGGNTPSYKNSMSRTKHYMRFFLAVSSESMFHSVA
ncbi:uncharacterized protein METZ01_LOCUS44348, partial [marine metagenome]